MELDGGYVNSICGRSWSFVGTIHTPLTQVAPSAELSGLMNRGHPWLNEKRFSQVNGSSGFDFLGLGFHATCFDGDLDSIFHRIFEGHLDSEQAVLVDRFGFVRFHRPT